MKPWFMLDCPRISWRDRLRLLLGVPLWVRFDSPDGECHAACSVDVFVQREAPADHVWGSWVEKDKGSPS